MISILSDYKKAIKRASIATAEFTLNKIKEKTPTDTKELINSYQKTITDKLISITSDVQH